MSATIPPVDQAAMPASVRTGTPAHQQAYATALGFEQVLVQQLATEVSKSAGGMGTGAGTDASGAGNDEESAVTNSGCRRR